MNTKKFDFSHLTTAPEPKKFNFSGLDTNNNSFNAPKMADTFLGQMPAMDISKIKENPSKEEINEMLYQMFPFAKGVNLVKTGGETGLKALFAARKIIPRKWVDAIQKGHDVMKEKAQSLFDSVKQQAEKRKVPNMKISDDLLNEAKSYLPDTRASKNLIENAKNGDYKSVFNLQSELGKRGFKRLSHDMPSENDMGELMIDTRDKILEGIKNHFQDTGHGDLADTMNNARNLWSNLKRVYYPSRIPQVGQMVEEGYRKVPSNIPGLLSQESIPMQNLLNEHPEITNEINTLNNANNIKRNIGNLGKISLYGSGIGAGLGIPYSLYKLSKASEAAQNLNQGNQ